MLHYWPMTLFISTANVFISAVFAVDAPLIALTLLVVTVGVLLLTDRWRRSSDALLLVESINAAQAEYQANTK